MKTLMESPISTQNGNGFKKKNRKRGLNRNKKGSVRKINNMIYVDFSYFNERVREPSGLTWNDENALAVRKQLDRIVSAIQLGTFRFADVFPQSGKKEYFSRKEQLQSGGGLSPSELSCGEYLAIWYERLKHSGRVSERTMLGYKDLIRAYLQPFFQSRKFSDLNSVLFDQFFSWARKRRYRGYVVSNSSLNKCMTVWKMVCKSASIEHGWSGESNPFHGYKKLPVEDAYEKIFPFSIEEQEQLIEALPEFWKPYFKFAFCSGLRQGEQIAIKPEDIDWEKGMLHIQRAITRGEDGKLMEGRTKNRYSRRTIKLLPVMLESLEEQKQNHSQAGKPEYFFCTPTGTMIHTSNLRRNVWKPALEKAGLEERDMRQTRHSFATNALSSGENPLWIAKTLGHKNTEMLIRVYGKYIEKRNGTNDGSHFNNLYQGSKSKKRGGKIWASFGPK